MLIRLVAVLFLLAGPAWAIGADEQLADPAAEARAQDLHKQLRCLVCQNQSIADSNASLAKDLREIVRERVAAGESDDQVLDYVVERYGQWVLLQPPFNAGTYALWLGPFALLLLAGAGVRAWLRRAPRAAPPSPELSEAERKRVSDLLDDVKGSA